MKHVCTRFSIINQVAILMLLLGLLGIAGMSVASWMAQSIQGNAHAINSAGSLRMQSYRLLAGVPLQRDAAPLFGELEQTLHGQAMQGAIQEAGLERQYQRLRDYWTQTLRPSLQNATMRDDAAAQVAGFVEQLDGLVSALDRQTEQRLRLIALVQKIFIALTLLLLAVTVWYLRRRLLYPWRQLVGLSLAISRGDFTQRFSEGQAQDEMATLGATLNVMSGELSQMYGKLETRVAEKTADLQRKNHVLSYLYRASRHLHAGGPLCARLMPVLNELQELTPLNAMQIRLYENNSDEQFSVLSAGQATRPEGCALPGCDACLRPSASPEEPQEEILSWSLSDQAGRYGLLLARLPVGQALTPGQSQLILTLAEQITSTLALEQQAEHMRQLAVMEERSAIARELHDSIAQSLSCLKMQISFLQMQSADLPEKAVALLGEMREELNAAYRQLRELLTTFRLRLEEPGLLPALQITVEEFNQRLGFAIDFDYRLPARCVSSHHAIHLLQIAREALSNVLKHAGARHVTLYAGPAESGYALIVRDDGRGIGDDPARRNHYGLIIMADRARNLGGECTISRREQGGTEVRVSFPAGSGVAG